MIAAVIRCSVLLLAASYCTQCVPVGYAGEVELTTASFSENGAWPHHEIASIVTPE